ncbi:MAG: hypothetical protein ACTSPV_17740 [Candidatus Hodarchaeales archaeon]
MSDKEKEVLGKYQAWKPYVNDDRNEINSKVENQNLRDTCATCGSCTGCGSCQSCG